MYTLLIVDDETIIRQGLRMMIDSLASDWKVVAEARNGREALEQIEAHRPDLVMTDIRMPQMDGIELQRVVRCRYPDVACVVLSGHSEFAYAQESLKLGARDYLLKPVDREELKGALERVREEWVLPRGAARHSSMPQPAPATSHASATAHAPAESRHTAEHQRSASVIERAIQYVQQHYAEQLPLAAVAAHVNLNPSYFSSLFKQKTGKPFSAFVAETRLEAAKQLLRETDWPVQEIAEHTGFVNIRHFNRVFKDVTRLTPKAFRQLEQVNRLSRSDG